MNKLKKVCLITAAAVFGVLLMSCEEVFAATTSAARQLEKGIELYKQNKPQAAMDYFINVMLNGNTEQANIANQYVNKIHNQLGGIQTPVEVDVNFKEGVVRELEGDVSEWNLQAQQAQDDVQYALDDVDATLEEQTQNAQQALEELEAQQRSLAAQIEANRAAIQNKAGGVITSTREMSVADAFVNGDSGIFEEDVDALYQGVQGANRGASTLGDNVYAPSQQTVLTSVGEATAASTFSDLTSSDAVQARNLYTEQKLASMKQAVIDKIVASKGAHLYLRDGQPDAIDIDEGVLFQGTNFRAEALPLLNNIYELLALQQGAQYVILPPGSYTDDVNLAGMREASALNSYLVKRGISQGKLTYNMGLVDGEAPARFANLKGLAIVFDYDALLPTRLQQNENNETTPLLSMAIVPQCHAIDRSLGEAYAIDFSVLETVTGIDNWVLQVVQHGRDGNFYVVRKLEGFSPVYHQILWNGRKGIIGPELPCGKYTIVLTATDLKGTKQTLRRRVVVKCSSQQSDDITATCGVKTTAKKSVDTTSSKNLNYNAPRLWNKPARMMGGSKTARAKSAAAKTSSASAETESSTDTSTYTHTQTVTNIVTNDTSSGSVSETTVSSADAYYGDMPANIPTTNPYAQPGDDLN